MKFKKQYILCFILIAIGTLVIANVAFANNSTDLKEYNFDSHFTMKIPQNVSLEKTEGQKTGDITLSIVYKNDNAKINIIYVESNGTKEKLSKAYEDIGKNDSTTNVSKINNTTVVHFSNDRAIGEINYHDLAIAGDDEKYVLMQCDNESLMKSMAESIKFK